VPLAQRVHTAPPLVLLNYDVPTEWNPDVIHRQRAIVEVDQVEIACFADRRGVVVQPVTRCFPLASIKSQASLARTFQYCLADIDRLQRLVVLIPRRRRAVGCEAADLVDSTDTGTNQIPGFAQRAQRHAKQGDRDALSEIGFRQ
jgi:hypothetical protein